MLEGASARRTPAVCRDPLRSRGRLHDFYRLTDKDSAARTQTLRLCSVLSFRACRGELRDAVYILRLFEIRGYDSETDRYNLPVAENYQTRPQPGSIW